MSNNGDLFPILDDITKGYSEAFLKNKKLIIKHSNYLSEIRNSTYYYKIFYKYKNEGLPTKEEKLSFLKEEKEWTDLDESYIEKTTFYLNNLKKTRNKLAIQSQKEQIQADIDKTEKELSEKISKKNKLVGVTCEDFAKIKRYEYEILNCLFQEDVKTPFFTEDEFDYLSFQEFKEIGQIYYNSFEKFTDQNLKKIALMPVFYNTICFMDKKNCYKFFNEDVKNLTFIQQRLLTYAINIRNITENILEDIPEEVREDYDLLLDFYKKTKENKKFQKHKNSNAGYSIVGAKNQDFKNNGIDTSSAITPFDILKKSGKQSLNKKDFLNVVDSV